MHARHALAFQVAPGVLAGAFPGDGLHGAMACKRNAGLDVLTADGADVQAVGCLRP